MRDIKFRGLASNKKFVYGWLVQNIKPVGERMIIGTMEIHQPYGDWNEEFEVYDDTVGQFTGLIDCNGVKIFEGDIVEDEDHYISTIYWDVNDFMFCATDVGGLVDMCSQTKVIGNIHQNPELLERAND